MATMESKIQAIIRAHNEMIGVYILILDQVVKERLFPFYSRRVTNPMEYILRKNISRTDKMLLLNAIPTYLIERRKRRVQVFRPFIEYLIKIHMRHKLERLHRSYILELNSPRGDSTNEEVDALRVIANDTKALYDTLPSRWRLISAVIMALALFSSLVTLAGLGSNVQSLLQSLPGAVFIAFFMVFESVAIVITITMQYAFNVKRSLFLDSNLSFHLSDIYLDNNRVLYEKSVYHLEDKLFQALSHGRPKPKEMPFDILVTIAFGVVMIIILCYTLWIMTILGLLVNPTENVMIGLGLFVFLYILTSYQCLVTPLVEYKQRLQSQLL